MPAANGITTMSLVILPVVDQDRSIAFYEGIGLEKRVDQSFAGGQMRWVEVYAPDTTTGIALAPPPQGSEVTPHATGITFQSEDIDRTYAAFAAQGVDVDTEITRWGGEVPDMFWFRDPDGHSLIVVQPTG